MRLTNTREPDFRRLPESDRADMDFFLAQLRIVLPFVSQDLLRPAPAAIVAGQSRTASEDGQVFIFEPVGARARGMETEEGFVVLAGSTARSGETGTFPAGYRTLRDGLLANGSLSTDGGHLRFTRDIAFGSPSAAAAIVAGRSASGPGEWRTSEGVSYRDVKAAEVV